MTDQSLPFFPFFTGSMITDPQYFVGRKAELDVLTSAMTGVHPESINVVGKRAIGKSSLLYHFFQTYQQRVRNPNRYITVYLDLQECQCQDEIDFYHEIARELLNRPTVWEQRALIRPFYVKFFERQTFASVLGEWKRQGVLPVICLDGFEALFHHSKAFNDGFFDHLRSLMSSNMLMLVVASHRKLDFYRQRYKLTSLFFNFDTVLHLGELTQTEARELVNLPASKFADVPAALNPEEQSLALEWGGCHPYLLQLAASLLWEARQTKDKSVSWAKAKFDEEARHVPQVGLSFRRWWRWLRSLLRF